VTKEEAREHMELAVQVMRKSVSEPRVDGKNPPRVGAVLVRPDGTVDTACRGELRHGDHAEFTLLERKNRDRKLDGSTLFATLEPCAPDARRSPKIACAERIVLARITEVWVGIEDPDPTVDRKGITHLQNAGISVRMFDRDLQEVIRDENRDFLAQATERAAAQAAPKPPVLSSMEDVARRADFDDLSRDALDEFRLSARVADQIDSPIFRTRLVQLGLLEWDNDKFRPTGFGLILFGTEPRSILPQVGLLCTIRYRDGTEEIASFEGPQVLVPGQLMKWLGDKLPNVIGRTTARRRNTRDTLFPLVREGIVNALVHRDYDIAGAKCQVFVTPDIIEIRSPGLPISPITLEQLQSFDAPMLSRNPVLQYVFVRMGLAEERGMGLDSMRKFAKEEGLPLPKFTWQNPYLILTVYRTVASATATLPEASREALSLAEQEGWQWLTSRGRAKSPEYARAMGVDERTARRHLAKFAKLGLARIAGSARSTIYEVASR